MAKSISCSTELAQCTVHCPLQADIPFSTVLMHSGFFTQKKSVGDYCPPPFFISNYVSLLRSNIVDIRVIFTARSCGNFIPKLPKELLALLPWPRIGLIKTDNQCMLKDHSVIVVYDLELGFCKIDHFLQNLLSTRDK